MILSCDYAFDIIVFSIGGLWSCLIDNIPLIMFYICSFCTYVYVYVCTHNVHTAHICIVCNSVICDIISIIAERILIWLCQDSNHGPFACLANALPIEQHRIAI